MLIPNTERETLMAVMHQAESDLKSAHAEICKLQKLDPEKHTWPFWTPQANTLRWFVAIRGKFDLCDGHVASETDKKICARCGTHIDSLRPEPDVE